MANVFVEEQSLQDIADAIREVNGKEDKYLPSEMGDAILNLEYLKYATSVRSLFSNAVFPEGLLDIKLNLLNLKSDENANMNATFNNTNLRSVKIYIPSDIIVDCWGLFLLCKNLEYVEFTNGIKSKNVAHMFNTVTNIKKILGEIDVSLCTVLNTMFSGDIYLEEVYFVKNTIKLNISFANSPLLIDQSIQSIIDGLADLTDSDAQTITFHADVKAKLTDEQIASITSKNWTLA